MGQGVHGQRFYPIDLAKTREDHGERESKAHETSELTCRPRRRKGNRPRPQEEDVGGTRHSTVM